MVQDCEVRFLPIWVGVVGLFAARCVVERRINVRWATRKHKCVQRIQLVFELFRRQFQRDFLRFRPRFPDRVEIVLELLAALFRRGAPGDAHTGAISGARLGVSRDHGTPNRSIRKRERQPVLPGSFCPLARGTRGYT